MKTALYPYWSKVTLLVAVSLFGVSVEAREACPRQDTKVAEPLGSPAQLDPKTKELTEHLRVSTPPLPEVDAERVADALATSRELFRRHREAIRGLIASALGEQGSQEIVDWFLDQYQSKLAALGPERRVLDGRRSKYLLPRAGLTVRGYFDRDRHALAAIVTEIELGEHVIFVGPRFFELTRTRQAQLLLHETLHALGASFGDEALTPVLRAYSWYDPNVPASNNLQRFFEEVCR